MASVTEMLAKTQPKKPFKKREVRSYSFMDDQTPTHQPAVDKPTDPEVTSSDRVEPTNLPHLPLVPETTQPLHTDPSQTDQTHMDSSPVDLSPLDPIPSDSGHTDPSPVEEGLKDSGPVDPSPLESTQGDYSPLDASPVDYGLIDPSEVSSLESLGGYITLQKGPSYGLLLRLNPFELKIMLFCTLQAFNRGVKYHLKEGTMHAGHGFLAKGTGLSKSTVKRTLETLEAKKHVAFVRPGPGRSGDIYRISDVLYRSKDSGRADSSPLDPSRSDQGTIVPQTPVPGSNRPPNKEVKEKKETSGGSALWALYSSGLEKKGIEAVRDGKVNTQLAALAEELGTEKATRLVTAYLKDSDPFVVKAAYSIGVMLSRKQQYLNAKAKPKPVVLFGEADHK